MSIDAADIRAAAGRFPPGHVVRTPLLPAPGLGEAAGARVWLKLENLNTTGAFKIRGAFAKLTAIPEKDRAKGVVAWSSGNHGQAVAYAARTLGMKAVIVMPDDAPGVKVAGVESRGAEIVYYDRASEDREEIGRALAAETGATLVPSYDDPHIIAGQGSAGLEIAEQWPQTAGEPDLYLCPVSGGGLLAGTATALKDRFPALDVIGVEPEGFDDTARSLKAGKRVRNASNAGSICDALLVPSPGSLTFPVLQDMVGGMAAVSDEEVRAAVRYAALTLKIVAEPGGAAALAALLSGRIEATGKRVVVMISGGNIDTAALRAMIAPA